ncbi:MAG: hypothetical protein HZB55_09775 [Deltaproteobacteria bacterium]|nr:hypothetical protein [Deltaproteobacteria bacterium]
MRRAVWIAVCLLALVRPGWADLRYAEATGPTSLNPFFVRDMPSLRAVELLYEGLVTPAEGGTVRPLLAESWTVAPDGLSVTFRLKRGVTWHDGRPFTSRDVVFTINAGRDRRTPTTLRGQFEAFGSARALDDRTVVVPFNRKVLNPLLHFDFKILPAHLFPEGFVGAEMANRRAVGTGPYVFTQWAPSGEIRLAANRSYHRPGEPSIPGITVSAVPDDNIRNELLRYGAVDLLPQVRPRDIPALEELTGVRLYPYSTLSYSFLGLNFRNPLLRDLRLRQALARGLDREEMLKAHYGGRGILISGPFPPASWAYNFDVKPWSYDFKAAEGLLDEMGATDKDKDGVRSYKGSPLSFRLVSLAQSEAQKAVILDVQQQLKNLGIRAEVKFLEPLAWKKAVFEDHDFDLVLAEWTFDNNVNVYSLFHSTEAGTGRNNMGAYANPDVDRLLEQSRGAPTSEALRATYGELHRLLRDDLPYVFLWSLQRYAAVSSRIDSVRLHPFYFFTHVGAWKEK